MTVVVKTLSQAYTAGISGPVGAPSTKHVVSDVFSIVWGALTERVGDQLHLSFLQVLGVTSLWNKDTELMLTRIPTTPNSLLELILDFVVHTVPLTAISSDGALKPCRELSVQRRKTHYSCRCWLHRAVPVSPFDLQQGWNSKANPDLADLYLPADTSGTDVRTYVIVKADAVEMLVDDQLFNQEGLFLLCIGFIDGLLPQVHRELTDVGGVAEQISERQCFRSAEELKTPQQRQKARVFLDVSPIVETVGGSDNPARRDERTTTKEPLAKDCCDPGVWLYFCERAVHDFVGPPYGPLATRQLCKDSQDEFREGRKTNQKQHPEQLRTTCIQCNRLWGYGCFGACYGAEAEIRTQVHMKRWFSCIFSQAYTWEQYRIPSRFFFPCGRNTRVSSSDRDF